MTAPGPGTTSPQHDEAGPASGGGVPRGTPVSTALDMSDATRTMKAALAALNNVHGDGSLPTIPVKMSRLTDLAGGYEYTGAGVPVAIGISRHGDHPELTMLHEIGHFLDHQALDIPGTFASVSSPLLLEWRSVIDASPAVLALQRLRSQPGVRVQYIDYLLDRRELLARSYTQWVVIASANRALAGQLEQELARIQAAPVPYTRWWESSDFLGVAQAFDRLFRDKGWRA